MIKVYGFGGNEQLEDYSPFVLKVTVHLRMAKLPYELIADQRSIGRAPKKKLPFIEDDGKLICDSFFIIEHIKQHHYDFDEHLTEEQKARSLLITRTLDESVYWLIVYSRWQLDQGWQTARELIFAEVPTLLRKPLAGFFRRGVIKQLHSQGYGRHSEEEMTQFLTDSLDALSIELGDKDFLFGDKPASADLTAYAFLTQLMYADFYTPWFELANQYTSLQSYIKRIEQHLN